MHHNIILLDIVKWVKQIPISLGMIFCFMSFLLVLSCVVTDIYYCETFI